MTIFSRRPSTDDLSIVIDTTPTLSIFPPDRWSSVLVNPTPKIFTLSFGCHPLDGVTRGSPPPAAPPPLVTPLHRHRLRGCFGSQVPNGENYMGANHP